MFGKLRMPEVDEHPGVEEIFDKAREAARGVVEGNASQLQNERHVVVVTPGRMLMLQPCPPMGSMQASQVEAIERMISPKVKRNIAVIAYTEAGLLQKNIASLIPFFGNLLGFAYIGHAVWVFEGHPSALAAGCREADVLIVDGGMVPHLQQDWAAVASRAMRRPEIYIFDRKSGSLKAVTSDK